MNEKEIEQQIKDYAASIPPMKKAPKPRFSQLKRKLEVVTLTLGGVATMAWFTIVFLPARATAGTARLVGQALLDGGHVPPFRQELFAAVAAWGQEPCFELDRGLLPFFGVKGFGVHLNGYFEDAGGLGMWIGHRSATKKVDPFKLDNVVAGGIASGHGVFETLIKEGAEEAAMPAKLLEGAISVGEIRYRFEIPEGMRDDVLFVYDLEVPDDFSPENTDGEFDFFERMSVSRCLELVAMTDLFKFNVNLTIIDFALRHRLIEVDVPEHGFLKGALRGDLIREP